jgi:hypothetical protein
MYDYQDSGGAVVYQVVYFKAWHRRGLRRPDGAGGWTWGLDGVQRVLYRLLQLLAADPGAWVFITHNEKQVDALTALNLVATCSPGGASKWRKVSNWNVLAGRKVCIIPHQGVTGWIHADDLAARLAGKVAEVRILELPGKCKSVHEWIHKKRR